MCAVRWTVDKEHTVTEIHKAVVHRFYLHGIDEPDIFAADMLNQWEKSEPGQFVKEHAIAKPIWRSNFDHRIIKYEYAIIAELEAKKLSEFYL